jgi:hypothetical protein
MVKGLDGRHHVKRICDPIARHPAFYDLVFHPRILDVVERLIGPSIQLQQSRLILKPRTPHAWFDWHQDYPAFPHSNFDLLIVTVYLDHSTPDNGCLTVIPGSHWLGPLPHRFASEGAARTQVADRGWWPTARAGAGRRCRPAASRCTTDSSSTAPKPISPIARGARCSSGTALPTTSRSAARPTSAAGGCRSVAAIPGWRAWRRRRVGCQGEQRSILAVTRRRLGGFPRRCDGASGSGGELVCRSGSGAAQAAEAPRDRSASAIHSRRARSWPSVSCLDR